MIDEDVNCNYCSKNNGEETIGDFDFLRCGARAALVSGDGNAARDCRFFPMYDRREVAV